MNTLELLLSSFEVCDDDNNYVYYELRDGLVAKYNHTSISGIGVPKKGRLYDIHDEVYGTRHIKMNELVESVSVYELKRIY